MDFNSNGSPGYTYDIFDEVSAFTRQWAFTGNANMYNSSPTSVLNYAHSVGYKGYDNLPNHPININTSTGLVYYYQTYISKFVFSDFRPYSQGFLVKYININHVKVQ